MNLKSRHCLCAALLLGCVFVGTGRPQVVEDSIQVPGAWVGSLAYNSREDVLYGVCEQAGMYFAIDCDGNHVIASYQLSGALALAYDSTDNKAWCSYYGPGQESLAVIDGATHAIVKRMEMPGATIPVWDSVSDRVYVSCQTTGSVAVVDCATDSILTYIPVGVCPIKMYPSTLRRKLYALNYDAGTVSVINTLENRVVKTIRVRGYPNSGYYSRSVDKFYSAGPWEVVVIDGCGDSVLKRVYLGVAPMGMAGSDIRDLVTVAGGFGGRDTVYVIDARRDSIVSRLPVGRDAATIAWSHSSDLFYCANATTNNVSVITGDGSRVLRTLTTRDAPFVFAAVPRHRRIYVGCLNRAVVYVIRDASLEWREGQPSVPDTPARLHVSPSPFGDHLAIVVGPEVDAGVLKVLGGDGRLVRVLNLTKPASGVLRTSWDGRDSRGRPVPAGVYFVEGAGVVRAKIVKLKQDRERRTTLAPSL